MRAAADSLRQGQQVTYLTTFFNNYAWDYVEATVQGQTVRGFLRSGSLDIQQNEEK